MASNNQTKPHTSIRQYAKYSAIGFQFVVLFVFLSLGGNYADKKLHLHVPIFTLLGVALSLLVIFITIYKWTKVKDED